MSLGTDIVESFSALEALGVRARVSIRSILERDAAWVSALGGFMALADQGVISVTNFGTGVIIGRVCGKAEFGAYMLAWTLITVAADISAALITTPYTVFSPQFSRGQRSLYLGNMLIYQLLLSMMFALAITAGAGLGSWWGTLSGSVSSVVTTTGGAIVFISLREFVRRVSLAELKIGLALVVDLIACLFHVGGVLLLTRFNALTAARTYGVLGISSAVAAVSWLVLQPGAFRLDLRLCGRDLKRNWRFAKWVLGSVLLWGCAMYLYPWLLAAFCGTSVTGTWAACSMIAALGNPVLAGLGNYVGPKISHVYATAGIGAMQRFVHRCSLLFTLLLLPVVLVLAGCGERIVVGVYGKAYAGTAGIVFLLALNVLISALMYPYSRGFLSMDCARADMLINVVAVTLLFTVGIAGVKCYAAFGAAVSLLVITGVTAAIRIVVFARLVRRRS